MRPSTRFVRSLAILTAAVSAAGMAVTAVAQVGTYDTFTLTARADLSSAEEYDTSTPSAGDTAELVAGSPAFAALALDTLRNSTATASSPYPGGTVVSLPGTMAGLGYDFVPPYPLMASSDHPTQPDDEVENGPYRLSAHSDESSAAASATVGSFGSDAESGGRAAVDASFADGADFEVQARADGDQLVAADLRVSDVTATASIRHDPAQGLLLDSSFEATFVGSGGNAISVGDEGATFGPQGIPLDTAELADAFDAMGFEYRSLEPKEEVRDDGSVIVQSGGVQLRRAQTRPDGGTSTVVYTFGRATVTLSGRTATAVVDAPTAPPETTTTRPAPGPTTPAAPPPVQRPPTSSGPVATGGAPVTSPPAPDVAAPIVAGAAPETSDGPVPMVLALDAQPGAWDAGRFYPVLLLGAVLTLALSRLLGHVGIRLLKADQD